MKKRTETLRIQQNFIFIDNLRKAIKHEELILHYQPQVDIYTGEIIGMEALVRWQHPDYGVVPPREFIPAAEETGLIIPIGRWVLHTACAQNKAWQEAGLPSLTVSVNLSGTHLKRQDLVETIADILKETGLDPKYLELELTDSIIIQNVETAVTKFRDLKKIGIYLTIDDFAAGYSSLNHLKLLPIDKLKIDQSFIHNIIANPDGAAIVTAVIDMAKSLKLKVIAEGVETREQLDFLRKHGCKEIQGYYFNRPLSASAFTLLLHNRLPNEKRLTIEKKNWKSSIFNNQSFKILIIEDNPVIAAQVKEILKKEMEVIHAGTLSSGLKLLKTGNFDAVLLDLGLPDGHGFDLLTQDNEKIKNTPIIILTGEDNPAIVNQALQYGAQDYLLKGKVEGFVLRKTIKYAVERKKTLTKLKQNSQDLQASETRFRTIIENSADGIIILSKNGIILFVNPAAETFLNQKAEEITGKLFGFPAGGKTSEIELVLHKQEHIVAMRKIEITWKNNQAYLVTLRDINAQVKIMNMKMESLVTSMLEGVIMLDERGDLVVINPMARYMLGFDDRTEITSPAFHSKISALKLEGDIEKCSIDTKRDPIVKEITLPHEKDKTLHCEITPVRSEEKALGVCMVLRDITKEKEVERIKSEFISIVSHELRTPLSSIKNAINIILNKSAGEINSNQEKFLSLADKNVNRLKTIIDDLLDISKIEAGKLNMSIQKVDLNDPVDTVLSSIVELTRAKSISLTKDIPSNLPNISADGDRLTQILYNLVGNALKFTPEGGEICISAKQLQIEKSNKKSKICNLKFKIEIEITVSDTGIGIPKEQLNAVFDKFHQVEGPMMRKTSGTGLGLPITKKLVELHHGTIRVESRIKKGTKFIFTIPVYTQKNVLKNHLTDVLKKAKETDVTISLIIIKINLHSAECGAFNRITEIIKKTLRRQGDRVLPCSDTEFLQAIVVETTKKGALSLCKRIKDAIKEAPCNDDAIKVAVAEYPGDSDNIDNLIAKAMEGVGKR